MTPEQLQQIEQARRYAEGENSVLAKAHIGNLLAIIEAQAEHLAFANAINPFNDTYLKDKYGISG